MKKYYRIVADKLFDFLKIGGQYDIEQYVCKMINAADLEDYRTASNFMDLALGIVPVSWGTELKKVPKPKGLEKLMRQRRKPGTYLRNRRRKD